MPSSRPGYIPLIPSEQPRQKSTKNKSFSAQEAKGSSGRAAILESLLHLSDGDISWIIWHALSRRPILESLLEQHKHGEEVAHETSNEYIEQQHSPMVKAVTHSNHLPVLQFMAHRIFVCEDDACAEIRVIRVGGSGGHSEVSYTTNDSTASAGNSFVETKGVLAFEEGETMKSISVPLKVDSKWNPNREFGVELLSEGLVNARLDKHLSDITVVVLDDDTFPTTRYQDLIWEDRLSEVPNLGLVVEYVKMQWSHDKIRRASIKIILSDLFDNVLFLVRALLQMYLVDRVLNVEVSESNLLIAHERYHTLALVAAVHLAPQFIVHYLNSKKPFGLNAESLMLLQKTLFDRFLNYSPAAAVDEDILLAMSRDSEDVVFYIYTGTLKICKSVGRIVMICIMQFVAPLIFHQHIRWMTAIPLAVFPVLMFLFLAARDGISTAVLYERLRTNDAFIEFVEDAAHSLILVGECGVRDRFVQVCNAKIAAHNAAVKTANGVMVNNKQFTEWLSILLVAFYTLTAGWAVIDGQVPLGRYVTNLQIFAGMGQVYSDIYSYTLEIQEFTPGLKRLTHLMNVPTEWAMRSGMSQHCHAQSDKLFESLASKDGQDERDSSFVDQLPVCVSDVHFRYETSTISREAHSYSMLTRLDCGQEGMNFCGQMRLSQGQLVRLIGPHGEGKTTLLKLIGGILMPKISEDLVHQDDPFFFIPTHLRSVYVSGDPVFLRGSLLENLIIGLKLGSSEGSISRVLNICKLLGLESLSSLIEDEWDHSWMHRLSHTEHLLLCLARAFIANPQLLCVERHWMSFNQATSLRLMHLFRKHVDNKGLEQDHHQRPRTCIMTSVDSVQGSNLIDCTFRVSREKGIELVTDQEAECATMSRSS